MQKRRVVHSTQRRRQDFSRPSPLPQEASAPSSKHQLLVVQFQSAENCKKEVQRTLLGTLQPGDSIPVLYG
ncbi:hypothetical protein WJX82_001973 [Trebouxia sp. C0006]